MYRTIVYFDDYLATAHPGNMVEGRTLAYLQNQLGPKNTNVLGFGEYEFAEIYIRDPSNHPDLFICDHNLSFCEEPLLKGEYLFRKGHQWMNHIRSIREDLRAVPIIIYTDDPTNAEFEWTWSPTNVSYITCVPKYNYKGLEATRLKPWEILLQEILRSPPFIEGSPRVEGKK
jgi:hypothetical protein